MEDPRTPATRPKPTADRLLLAGEAPQAGVAEASTFVLPTGTVTFLLTDVEGSTAAWERAPEAMAKAIDRHYQILADVIGRHRGVRPVEQGEGDSIVAAFSRGTDAVAAALEGQQLLAAETWPDGASLAVRMALHTGDAQLRDAFNYFGPVIIRCARLRALAAGGQVLATGAAHDVVADGLPSGASWVDLGLHRLKDLGRPERVFQLCHRDLRSEFPELTGLDATPNNLPAQVSSFIGREAELQQVCTFLDRHRLVTLTGAGGCGKTRLALQAAAERAELHPGGIRYIELAALVDEHAVDRQVAAALGIDDVPGQPLVDLIADRIGGKEMLLILDNCEHLIDRVAATIDVLLRCCPSLVVLATSRQPLGLLGEVSWRLPSMAVPEAMRTVTLEALGTYDAVRLFVDRATRGRPDFVLDAVSAPSVLSICRRLDGIPLALELAAARVRLLGLTDIAAGLDDCFRLLTGGSRTLLPRQQTLAASVDWSHDLLDASEQLIFRRLSVFAGAFTLDGARAVAEDEEVPYVALLLGNLVDRSLVQLDDYGDGLSRYRYLETVKAYARARLVEADEADQMKDRHLAFHVELAELAEPRLRDHEDHSWLVELDRSYDDVRAALRWGADGLSAVSLLRLTAALGPYWHARGHANEAQAWYTEALAAGGDGPERAPLRARALWASAYVALYANDLDLSQVRAKEALSVAEGCGDERTVGRATDTLATLLQFVDPIAADRDFERALETATRVDDLWCRTDAMQKIAWSGWTRDRWDEAVLLGAKSRVLAEQLDNPFFLAWNDVLDATAALRAGRIEESRTRMANAFRLASEVGEPMTIGAAGALAAEVELVAGNVDDADAAVHATASALVDAAPDGLGSVTVGLAAGCVLLARGDGEGAIALLAPLLGALVPMKLVQPPGVYLPFLGLAQVVTGDLEAAETTIDSLDRIHSVLDSSYVHGHARLLRALVERSRRRADLAEEPAREALSALLDVAPGPLATLALEVLAGVLGELGNHAEATRLLAAAASARIQGSWLGRPAPWCDDLVAGDLAAAAEALGERFESHWDEGASLGLAAAAEHASRARGTRTRPASGWASLTPTELAVVRLVAGGESNPEIAALLVMSRGTVKTHVSHILTKLGLRTRAEVAAEAARRAV